MEATTLPLNLYFKKKELSRIAFLCKVPVAALQIDMNICARGYQALKTRLYVLQRLCQKLKNMHMQEVLFAELRADLLERRRKRDHLLTQILWILEREHRALQALQHSFQYQLQRTWQKVKRQFTSLQTLFSFKTAKRS